ncbi:response regulator transcription factor [Gimesia maris]|uniref:Transcriptional regulatory protein TdiR n=1 Tax=Gimesia maris TaxID=122 RepID=A0ABX5YQE5_9PLAN|nr:response regulator [Gimesia maris]EDL60448.1 regulatory protein, LuxR:Response regulator receiver [Gimesia maris DSM 8797]QDU15767.1 Transcriptional regulatory protein TdiR [Gimesia maris]QEG17790.1 Transcriptional regulatory protein TdiR [Gimesia maris]QGQ29171.1 response regulator transcription factor [Gimesia maris]
MTEFYVYIIDDDPDVLDSIAYLLRTSGYTVKPFNSVFSFLESNDLETPGCVLIDLIMPEISGIEAMQLLDKRQIRFPVIIMSAYGDIEKAVSAVKQGACEYLEKPFAKNKCIQAVETARTIWNQRTDETGDNGIQYLQLYDGLTRREKQVFHLIAEGHSGKQIANSMTISYRTMEKHKANVLNKLGVSSTTDIVHILYKIKDMPGYRKNDASDSPQ